MHILPHQYSVLFPPSSFLLSSFPIQEFWTTYFALVAKDLAACSHSSGNKNEADNHGSTHGSTHSSGSGDRRPVLSDKQSDSSGTPIKPIKLGSRHSSARRKKKGLGSRGGGRGRSSGSSSSGGGSGNGGSGGGSGSLLDPMQGIDDDGDKENAIDATTTGAGTSTAAAAAARAVRSSRGRPQACGSNATRQREEKRARPPSPPSATVAPTALRGAPEGVAGVEGSNGDEDDAMSGKAAPAVPTATVAATTRTATTTTTATAATAAATAMDMVTATATVGTPTTMAMGYEEGGISKGPFAPLVPLTPLVPLGKDGTPAANPASNTIDFSAHSTHLAGSAERVEHKRARTDNVTAGRDTTSTAENWVKVHRAGGPPRRVVVPSGRAAGAVLREGYFPGQASQQTTEEPAAGTGGEGEDGGWEML